MRGSRPIRAAEMASDPRALGAGTQFAFPERRGLASRTPTTDVSARPSDWSRDMDYVKPADVAAAMVNAGRTKLALSATDLVQAV